MSSAQQADRTDYGGAEDRTRERAALLLRPKYAPDRRAADDLARAFEAPGTSLADVRGQLPYVGVEHLLDGRNAGKRAVPLLVIADEMETRLDREGQVDLPVFADALTALLVACHREPPEDGAVGLPHVAHAAWQYLAARLEPGFAELDRDLLDHHHARRDFDELARRIPWLLWWAPDTEDPPHALPVGPDELVDLLVLVRPRRERRSAVDRPLERFARLYRCAVELDVAVLDDLADALGWTLDAPHTAARRLQSLRLPEPVRAAAERRVFREIDASTDLANMLAVLVDDSDPTRAVFVNLSRRQMLRLPLTDRLLELPPNAVDEDDAFDYCSPPVPLAPQERLRRGRTAIPLDEPVEAMADHIDFTSPHLPVDIFRGRARELARLRTVIQTRGPRRGSLISGPRRAGKSTLMERVRRDSELRWSISFDVSSPVNRVTNFVEWNKETSRKLVAEIRHPRRLPGFVPTTEDLVETLIDLDAALDGGPPVGIALDELDVLLAPEQGGDGLHMASRLGSRAFRNLVVMGTVQRFHRNEHEFKNWQKIECLPDLTWTDGVTYFFGPLDNLREGPRVDWLTRVGVTPEHFARLIVPTIGLRPYFWAQLRDKLDSAVRAAIECGESGCRLADGDLITTTLAELVADQHLTIVMDRGTLYDAAERRRKDLFSDDERRILLEFATTPQPGAALPKDKAESIGGAAAVKELIDRAWLTYDPADGRLRIAVRVYEDYLRSVVSDLREVIDAAPAPAAPAVARPTSAAKRDERRPAASTSEKRGQATRPAGPPRPARDSAAPSAVAGTQRGTTPRVRSGGQAAAKTARPAGAGSGASPTSATEANRSGAATSGKPPSTSPKRQVADTQTKTGSATASNPMRSSASAKAPTSRASPATGQAKPAAGPTAAPRPVDYSSPTEPELKKIHAVLLGHLAVDGVVKFSAVGQLITQAVPRIGPGNNWCGTGRLTNFFDAYLREFEVGDGEHDREVRAAKVRRGRFSWIGWSRS